MKRALPITTILLTILAVPAIRAQQMPTVPLVTVPVDFDGRVDDEAWRPLTPLPMHQLAPASGSSSGRRSEVRIAHDGKFLYVAGRFFDDSATDIIVRSLTRDRIEGDDRFTLLLDTFNDNESASFFVVTPAGTRRDAAISQDGEGANSFEVGWNTYWEARTERSAEGWSMELRIPFRSLRFQSLNGATVMGISATRVIARTNEYHTFPALTSEQNRPYLKPSLAQDFAVKGIHAARPLQVTPYLLAGVNRIPTPSDSEGAYHSRSYYSHEAGLDVKVAPTSNFTLDLTYNTDFAQVEADEPQVNLTRFSPLIPEKRPFFQERAGIFQFGLGGSGRLFYSRRVGLGSDGLPLPVLGGARLVGRVGGWDVGALTVRISDGRNHPAQSLGAYRVRRRVLNQHSTLGAMLTHRVEADGVYSVAAGGDGLIKLGHDQYLGFSVANSINDSTPNSLDGSVLHASLERRRLEGIGFSMAAWYTGRTFEPALGFQPISDAVAAHLAATVGWRRQRKAPYTRHVLGLSARGYRRNTTGQVEQLQGNLNWTIEGERGGKTIIDVQPVFDRLERPLPLPAGVHVPVGEYSHAAATVRYQTPRGQRLIAEGLFSGGRFFDGHRFAARITPTWFASPNLDIAADYELNALRFPKRGQAADIHAVRTRVRATFTRRLSVAVLAQLNTGADRLTANARLRYSLRDGSDLWLVYNEGINTDRMSAEPALPRSSGRTFTLKYSHTIR